MDRLVQYLPVITLCIGGWAVVNGILHDIAVLAKAKTYDRELLNLLLNGHILIACGAFQMLAYQGFRNEQSWAYYIAGTATLSLLIYCGLIFPFLKSMGTIFLNAAFLALLLYGYFKS